MPQRLQILSVSSSSDIAGAMHQELKDLTGQENAPFPKQRSPFVNCVELMELAGCRTLLIQRRVRDPDFSAEYSAYYSRQFSSVEKFCSRIHFFSEPKVKGENELAYLDKTSVTAYLGFVTIRPVVKSPIGASIFSKNSVAGFVRSFDDFPVHIAGKEYSVQGTPFMQQDNAVGACAQASIWMALRTLRKREGDRAHDPAQITDAATRYLVSGRTLPNRNGLTEQQMTEAIRAAGYSPHLIPLGNFWHRTSNEMTSDQIDAAVQVLHPYIESEIPVILILYAPNGGHAVLIVGHTWERTPAKINIISIPWGSYAPLHIVSAVSWAPSFIVHNDSSGPYRKLDRINSNDYCMQWGASAIPLLPGDVFMSGEEASAIAHVVISDFFLSLVNDSTLTEDEARNLAASLNARLSLVEKRKLRRWAATTEMAVELKEKIRLMDSPRRLWIFELNLSEKYGENCDAPQATQIGMLLIDSTGDDLVSSLILLHLNMPQFVPSITEGALLHWTERDGVKVLEGAKTSEVGPIFPIR